MLSVMTLNTHPHDPHTTPVHPVGDTAPKENKALSPVGAAGFAALILGLIAWLWTGEWRWAVTGVAVLLICAVAGAVEGRRTRG